MPPTLPPTKSTVTVAATTNKPAFTMFRDGPGAQWAAMTAVPDGTFTATVTGPYEVAIVCQTNAGGTWVTWEHGDSPDAKDPTTTNITPPCNDVVTHKLTGTIATAGTVSIGTGTEQTVDANGTFTFNVVAGKYDVVVHTATTVAFGTAPLMVADNDGPTVNAGAVALSAPVTLGAQPFTSDELDVDDAEAGALQVLIATPNSPMPSVIFSAEGGTKGDKSVADITGQVIAAADVPKGYTQQVTYSGTMPDKLDDTQMLERSTNRNYTVGDSLKIVLPSGFGSVVWFADPAGMSFIGDSDPPDTITETLTGLTTEGKNAVSIIELTQNYLSDTNLARVVLETDLTGYLPTWKVDTNQAYTRGTQGLLRVDDLGTDPVTHDNREWHSTQDQGAP